MRRPAPHNNAIHGALEREPVSTTSATPGSATASAASTDLVIRRINDRFVSIRNGSVFKVVFSPIRPGIKLFDTPPTVADSKPASANQPVSVIPASTSKPADVTPPGTSKPASTTTANTSKPADIAAPSTSQSVSAAPAVADTPVSVAPASKPADIAPASTAKPAAVTPAAAAAAPTPDILPAEHDKIDGKDVLVYGYPKSYDQLDYSQGFAVSGYFGTCTEASVSNLLKIAGQDVSEADVVKRAIVNKWCDTTSSDPSMRGGAFRDQQQAMLKSYGVATEVFHGNDMEKLGQLVKEGKGVIMAVNAQQLWGADLPPIVRKLLNLNHVVNLTGVVYAADTGKVQGFYIADSGRGVISDQARYLTVKELDAIGTTDDGYGAIYTVDPIKKAHVPESGPADPSKPQRDKEHGVKLIVYGDPKAYHNLDYDQPVVMAKYTETSGEIAVANIAALAGQSLSPKTVLQTAIEEKLCDTTKKDRDLGGGTTSENQVALLKKFGIAATLEQGFDANAVAQHIIEGKGVILRVNGGVLWSKTEPDHPGRSDYSVTVTGVAFSADTGEVAGFYLADPGFELSGATSRTWSCWTLPSPRRP